MDRDGRCCLEFFQLRNAPFGVVDRQFAVLCPLIMAVPHKSDLPLDLEISQVVTGSQKELHSRFQAVEKLVRQSVIHAFEIDLQEAVKPSA